MAINAIMDVIGYVMGLAVMLAIYYYSIYMPQTAVYTTYVPANDAAMIKIVDTLVELYEITLDPKYIALVKNIYAEYDGEYMAANYVAADRYRAKYAHAMMKTRRNKYLVPFTDAIPYELMDDNQMRYILGKLCTIKAQLAHIVSQQVGNIIWINVICRICGIIAYMRDVPE
jgi:hypothetical protein